MRQEDPIAAPVLEYRAPAARRDRLADLWAGRLIVLFALYPVLFLISLHGLWPWEYVAHGEPPFGLTHGPNNKPMEVLYWVVGCLYWNAAAAGSAGVIAIGLLLIGPPGRSRRVRWLAGIALMAWATSFAVFAWDPVGAWDFYID